MTRLAPGSTFAPRSLTTIWGGAVAVPDGERLVHLQLRRFAGCPVCNLHLRSITRRYDEIVGAGVREVVVFHSSAEDLRAHAAELPFATIADPGKALYREFGAEASRRALLDPRAWPAIARALLRSTWRILARRDRAPSLFPEGGRYGLPADFLIAPDGRVVACKYGAHASDQWSVDELLDLAGGAYESRVPSNTALTRSGSTISTDCNRDEPKNNARFTSVRGSA